MDLLMAGMKSHAKAPRRKERIRIVLGSFNPHALFGMAYPSFQ